MAGSSAKEDPEMKRRTLLLIPLVLASLLVGYALGAGQFTTTISGPGQTGTVTVTPNGVLIQSFAMNWTSHIATVALQNSGTSQVTSKLSLTFENSTSVIAQASLPYTLAPGTTSGFAVILPQGPIYFETVLIVIAT